MQAIESLNQRFAANPHLRFVLQAGVGAIMEVSNAWGTCTVSLYGGQVLTWQPVHQNAPVLWLSRRVQYVQGKAIRGGVPICWPWFGAHPSQEKAPAHGYARVSSWDVVSVSTAHSAETEVVLQLAACEGGQRFGTEGVSLSLRLRVGAALELALTTTNGSAQDFDYSEGLHTYFQVGDVSKISIQGLDGGEYADLLRGNIRCRQSGAIAFDGELGRIFVDNEATCVIEDASLQRRIRVEKSGSLSTAVWNPWTATASKMDDLGSDGWRDMVCVESANALENRLNLPAGQSHTLSVTYSVEELSVPHGR
jgi:D-hexose-6-phosphate mutarotase